MAAVISELDEAGRRGRTGGPVERAAALAPLLEAAAPRIEAGRELPEDVVSALHEAGLFRLLLPRSLGGDEVEPVVFVQAIEAVAKADASTAWCLGQASGCSLTAAYLDPGVARRVFAGSPRDVLAWGPAPKLRAVAVDGGYRVTGSWMFNSGSHHATWLGPRCPVYERDGTPRLSGEGVQVERTMLLPKSSARMADVWRVMGLKGTGSDAFSVSDLFVPEDHTAALERDAERREAGMLYRFSTHTMFAAGFAGVGLGIARSTLDAFVALAREKTPLGIKSALHANAVIQLQVAQAEGKLRAARAFLLDTMQEVWREVGETGRLTLDHRMAIRLAASHAILQAREVVDIAYHAAGATAIFESNPFERRFRDMHTVSQQHQGRQAHFESVGQYFLGVEADNKLI